MAGDDPRIALGSWVHDLLYQNHGVINLEDGNHTSLSRKQADTILAYEAVSFAVYQGLRGFGQGWPGDSFLELLS